MAALVIPAIGNNRLRHEALQRFMLANDSTTLAVEVPIWRRACGLACRLPRRLLSARSCVCGFDGGIELARVGALLPWPVAKLGAQESPAALLVVSVAHHARSGGAP
jgi:hypothetical protein